MVYLELHRAGRCIERLACDKVKVRAGKDRLGVALFSAAHLWELKLGDVIKVVDRRAEPSDVVRLVEAAHALWR